MTKTYVLDTNVLLHDPDGLFAFKDNHVVIPLAVVEEIDNQKKRQDELGRSARETSRKLDQLRASGNLAEGVDLPSGGRLSIALNHQQLDPWPDGLDPAKYDNRILALALHLRSEGGGEVILVTKDLNLRVKADVLGIATEDYVSDRVNGESPYQGVAAVEVAREQLDEFYRNGRITLNGAIEALPHQFVVLRVREQPSRSALGRCFRSAVHALRHGASANFGIKARNKEQQFAFELLLDDQIKIVTLVGRAGTGKTLVALAVGLEKVLEDNSYTRLLVTRPVIPVGDDLGYLPGSKEEKLRPWMQPIYDNLELLLGGSEKCYQTIDHLMERGVLALEALTYIRGRSIPRQYILCDEAQNLSPHMVKTLITRVGEGSKIVFTGDPEQIDHPYLDGTSNGLTYLVERLKAEEIAGHITLVKGERSEVAELGARIL
jgi:PhoH-like ATPase